MNVLPAGKQTISALEPTCCDHQYSSVLYSRIVGLPDVKHRDVPVYVRLVCPPPEGLVSADPQKKQSGFRQQEPQCYGVRDP